MAGDLMAYSDLDLYSVNDANGGAGGARLLGGADANARTHASLTNPLAGEGTYCREFTYDTGSDQNRYAVKAAYDGGSLVEIPDTKAVSVRAWVRLNTNNINSNCVGVGVKMDLSQSFGAPGLGLTSYNQPPYGYLLHIGNINTSNNGYDSINLYLYNRKVGASVGQKFVKMTTDANVSTIPTISVDTWYKIRMDVVPVGPVEDRIDVYTGTGATGSETWTLHHQETVVNSDAHYIPWGEVGGGEVGFFGLCGNNTYAAYLDRFQVFLTNV